MNEYSFKDQRMKLLGSGLLLVALVAVGFFFNASSSDFAWPSYLTIVALYLGIFLLGLFANNIAKNNAAMGDSMLAGRSLPFILAMFTMSATWIGGGYINGSAEYANTYGLAWVQAPWGYALSLIFGGLFFVKPMRLKNYTTMLDPLAERFGHKVTALLFLPALFGEIFWSAAILTALGTTFSVIIGIDPSISIIFSALIAITYTSIGGLWAVAVTDVLQLALVLIGLLLPLPFILDRVGGLDVAWSAYQEQLGSLARLLPPLDYASDPNWGNAFWYWIDSALLLVFGGLAWQVYFQRVLAAKDTKVAQGLSYSAGFICIIVAIPAIIIGIVGHVTDWQFYAGVSNDEVGALTLPYVMKYLSPPVLGVIGLAAIAAAVMSSVDSSILSASTMTSWNIFRPLFKPQAKNNKDFNLVLKISIVVIGLLAMILALKVQSVYALWFLSSDLVYCIIFPQLVAALFFKHANRYGALAGFFVALVLRLGGGEPTFGLPAFIPYPMYDEAAQMSYFPFKTLAMLSSMLIIVSVSYLNRKAVARASK